MVRARRFTACGAGSLFGLLACTDPDELERLDIRYDLPAVEVGTSFERPLCRGDLDYLNDTTETLRSVFGVEGSEKETVFLYSGHPPQCAEYAGGCFAPEAGFVATRWRHTSHELVHAVLRRRHRPSVRFWEEGLADALTQPTFDPERHVVANLDADHESFSYQIAGHVVRWVLEDEANLDASVALAEGQGLEETLGLDAARLEARYEELAPFAYPGRIDGCPSIQAPSVGAGLWEEELMLRCDASGVSTHAVGGELSTQRSLPVKRGARYTFNVTGNGLILISGCVDRILEEPPSGEGDVFHEVYPAPDGTPLAAGAPTGTTELTVGFDGTVRLLISSEEERQLLSYSIEEELPESE